MRSRLSLVLLGLALASPAYAQQGPELSGFVGVDYFGDRVKFSDSPTYVRDVYPGTSPVLGVRFAYLWSPETVRSFSGGFEVEGSFTPTYSENGIQADSMKSYFTPFVGYRLHAIARLGDERFGAHALAGVGGLTVTSGSPFLASSTTGQFYGGVGFDLRVAKVGIVRLDFRDAYMPAMSGGWTPAFEVQLGLTRIWGSQAAPPPKIEDEEEPVAEAPKQPPADKDSDGDGFPDSIDKCPNEPETVNGIEDQDGCPEKDSDGDGVVDKVDKCPTEPEDKDHYQDADGCPDPDNDGDGILDAVDVCPNEPETYNGFHDDDGCPDEVPDVIKKVLSDASGVQFEPGKSKIVKASQASSIRPLVGILQGQPEMRLVITAHPDKDGDKAADLAKKRAEAIRFYLEDQGIAIVRNDIVVGAVSPKGPVIEVALAVSMPPLPKPAAKPASSETLP